MTIKSFLDIPEKDRIPLNKELCEIFVKCCMLEAGTEIVEMKSEESDPFAVRALDRWCKHTKTKITFPLGVFLATASTKICEVVMWVYAMHQIQKKTGKDMLTTQDFADHFPLGIPNEEARDKIWEAQKVFPGDNLLDRKETWE